MSMSSYSWSSFSSQCHLCFLWQIIFSMFLASLARTSVSSFVTFSVPTDFQHSPPQPLYVVAPGIFIWASVVYGVVPHCGSGESPGKEFGDVTHKLKHFADFDCKNDQNFVELTSSFLNSMFHGEVGKGWSSCTM